MFFCKPSDINCLIKNELFSIVFFLLMFSLGCLTNEYFPFLIFSGSFPIDLFVMLLSFSITYIIAYYSIYFIPLSYKELFYSHLIEGEKS